MATISENLQTIKTSTDAIKQAIIDKGGKISGDITTWADAISAIESGGIQPTANLILNKLNGATIGEPNTLYSVETVLHTYNINTHIAQDEEYLDIICFPFVDLNNYSGINSNTYGSSFYNLHKTSSYNASIGYIISSWRDSVIIKSDTITSIPICVKHNGSLVSYSEKTNRKFIFLCGASVQGRIVYDYDTFYVNISDSRCYTKDTEISLYNGVTKKVQDINYNDELLVWNFDEGKFDKAKPLWIKKEEITNNYYKVTLDNGKTIGLVGSNGRCHRLFNYDDMFFESATELIGKNVYTLNGICKVISVENIKEIIEYYNIITDFHMNCFANGILTSCRYNNLYPIKNMIFDKSQVNIEPEWKVNQEKFIPNPEILPKYINGMRLTENTTIPIDEIKEYVINLENARKTVLDFNSEGILNNIENTEVGWIDREGKSYGFKSYMPGQNNHGLLPNKIRKELGIDTDNPSIYLEKEGWVKYTTDYVLNSDDKEITNKQLNTLRKFLKVPNKLKKEGKIRIGDYMSPYVDISEFDTMDKYSFEYRKKHNMR